MYRLNKVMSKMVWIISLIIAIESIAFTQETVPDAAKAAQKDSLAVKIDGVFAKWDRPNCPGCALALIKDGRIIYKKGYGTANLDYDIPITTSSAFYAGSIAKQFTAMCVALLVQQGKLSLDDNIRKYLPEIPDYGTPITIRHLIHHTSGLHDFWELVGKDGRHWDDAFTSKDVIEIVARQPQLDFKPGEKHLYSNTGYLLLAAIVQRVAGQSLRKYADEHIFKPLGMLHTRFHDDHTAILKNRVYGYVPENGDYGVYPINNDLVGAGGLWTTVEDLALWDQNFYSGKVGGLALIQQLQTTGTLIDGTKLDYAFGLHIDEYKGLRRVRHGGVFAGYRAEMVRFPDQRFSIAILCNLSSITPTGLANEMIDILLKDQLRAVSR